MLTNDVITYDIQNADLLRALKALEAQALDLSQPLAEIGQALETAVSERFDTESDPNGIAWERLSDKTLAMRAKIGKTGKKLFEHGTMLGSWSRQSDAKTVQVGFGQPYAAYHEWGTKHMPRRGLLMGNPDAGTLGADDLELVLDILSDHLAGA